MEVGACAEPRGQTILYIVAHGTPTASKVLLHHLILLKLHSESVGLVVEPLGKANEFQHYFGILSNANCIESIRVEHKIEVTAGIDPADPVLLQELQGLFSHDDILSLISVLLLHGLDTSLQDGNNVYAARLLLIKDGWLPGLHVLIFPLFHLFDLLF